MARPYHKLSCRKYQGNHQTYGIKDEVAEKMVLNALTLDCSEFAQNSFILYRGSQFHRDHVIASEKNVSKGMHTHSRLQQRKEDEFVYSLSYGSSLICRLAFTMEKLRHFIS